LLAAWSSPRGPRVPCALFAQVRWSRLPQTGREIEEATHLWKKHGPGRSHTTPQPPHGAGGSVLQLTGARASEAAFKTQVAGHRALYVATHGFFLGEGCAIRAAGERGIGGLIGEPSSSAPAMAVAAAGAEPTPAPPATVMAARAALGLESPLLLSELVFAGANHRGEAGPDDEDGILTVEEVAALDLSGVEWAVSSACDTGVGVTRAGEGVLGFRRAFAVAGARTLIMSLWSVEDEAARQWMHAPYEARLAEGKSTPEAAREASLRVLQARRRSGASSRPFYWAAFIATGDWR
jgi:hypothetical protein